ncbi:MAG TPA: hypothetical protein EYP30_05580 [Archaeoglobaceae archaeon]|nr:hypothetical protein [Archaeoglobaceae archaeon]
MQSIKAELARKSIHFLGVGYIPFYLYTGKDITLLTVVSLTIFALFVEFLKFRFGVIPEWILREHEIKGVGSHLYTGVSMSLVTFTLPMEACFVAIACGIVGDGISGLAKSYSRKISAPLMFLSLLILIFILSDYINFNLYSSVFACIAGAFAENFSKFREYHINDNFSVPLASSLVYTLLA